MNSNVRSLDNAECLGFVEEFLVSIKQSTLQKLMFGFLNYYSNFTDRKQKHRIKKEMS